MPVGRVGRKDHKTMQGRDGNGKKERRAKNSCSIIHTGHAKKIDTAKSVNMTFLANLLSNPINQFCRWKYVLHVFFCFCTYVGNLENI